jgi:hypothetical protein
MGDKPELPRVLTRGLPASALTASERINPCWATLPLDSRTRLQVWRFVVTLARVKPPLNRFRPGIEPIGLSRPPQPELVVAFQNPDKFEDDP